MNKILVIYNNPWIFAQTLSVIEELWEKDYDILINEKYHNTKTQISNSKARIFEHTKKETIDWITNANYDIVIRPTPLEDDWLELIYEKLPNAKYIYIEEWMWFYTRLLKNFDFDPYFKNWVVYLTYPEKYPWSKKFNTKRVFEIVKEWYKSELKSLPQDVKTILFTEPVVFDEHDSSYKEKINNAIESYPKPLLIKKHFRDDTKYVTWDDVCECLKQIPWQLLFDLYPQAKLIFTWNTTLELYIQDKTRILKI